MNCDSPGKNVFGISFLIFIVALLIRLPFLGRTALWGDEILYVQFMADASLSPWQTFLEHWDASVVFGHLPLAGVVLNVYMHLAGFFIPDVSHHVLALRIPGVLAGAFAVVGGYWLGRRLLKRHVNRVATAMAAVFYYPVYYSREVYCYPYVMLCAAFAFLYFFKSLFDEASTGRTVLALFLWSVGMGLSHFGCSVALAAMGSLSAGWWLWNIWREHRPAMAQRAAWTTMACILAGLAVAPYWVRILVSDSPYVAAKSPYSILRIANDVVSKFFLGDHMVPSLLAWLLLGIGSVSMWRAKTNSAAKRMAIMLIALVLFVLSVLFHESQYISSRYFAVLVPVAYIVLAEGLWAISRCLTQPFRPAGAAPIVFYALAIVPMSIHAGLFLPVLFRATEKGYPHAATAQWLNNNAVPGSPYFYDCGGFDMRYIPNYHPTPNLTPAVWIAGNGPGYMPDVHNIQRRLMKQFPVSYYIRNPSVTWSEADQFYRNIVEYRNPMMGKLRRYGIVTDVNTTNYFADSRDILFNTREDAIAMAKEAGLPVYIEYPGFRCARISQEVYGRVIDGREAELTVFNLRETPVQGAFSITGAISATNQESCVSLTLPSGEQMDASLPCGEFWTLHAPSRLLPAGSSSIRLTVSNLLAEKLLLMDVQFVAP